MTDNKLVSVVIATFNTQKYVGRAIRSVLQQTYGNIELIVVDDGSTDNTRELVKEFEQDDRFKYVYQENRGQAEARNHGVRLARGEFVAFNDADDFWYPQKLEKQMPLFGNSNDVGLVYSGRNYMDKHGEPLPKPKSVQYRGARLSSLLFESNFVPCNTCVVRRGAFERIGGFNKNAQPSEDWDLWLRLSVDYAFDYVSEPLVAKRFWSQQISGDKARVAAAKDKIMRSFLFAHPQVISNRSRRRAFAKNEHLKAHAAAMRGNRLPALRGLIRAFQRDPINSQTLKSFVKLGLGRSDLF